jgi:hypothetical protein
MAAAIKGENCTLMHIRGVKTFESSDGVDLLKLLKKGGARESGMDVDKTIMNLLNRVDTLEKFIKTMPVGTGTKGDKGDKGDAGEPGESITGAQGPRGKDGAKTISELKDVCLDGLDDGDVLMWSASKKQWITSRD